MGTVHGSEDTRGFECVEAIQYVRVDSQLASITCADTSVECYVKYTKVILKMQMLLIARYLMVQPALQRVRFMTCEW